MSLQVRCEMQDSKIWTLWILLGCSFPSLHGQHGCARPCEKNVTVTGFLNSAVLLPCTFTVQGTDQVTVVWSQSSDLVTLYKMEQIRFLDNREGRVKVLPYMSSIGDFSIQLDNLQLSDQGSYCCAILNESICTTVNIQLQKPNSTLQQEDTLRRLILDNWYFFAPGGVVFIVMVIACTCCVQHKFLCKSSSNDHVNEIYSKDHALQKADPKKRCEKSDKQDRGINDHLALDTEWDRGGGSCDAHETAVARGIVPVPVPVTIYENNEHDPVWGCVKRQPFFHEDPSCSGRAQQQDVQNSYYVNQSELLKKTKAQMKTQNKRSFWRKKTPRTSLDYENPIYSNTGDKPSQEISVQGHWQRQQQQQ